MEMVRAGHPLIFNKAVGAILDCTAGEARDNLGVLENPQGAASMAFVQRPPALRCDGSLVPKLVRLHLGDPISEL